jgi:FdhD protein
VTEEVPVALEYNGVSHAVMLATPFNLEDFALGFSFSEGILNASDDFYAFEEKRSDHGITLHLHVASRAFTELKNKRRALTGRTGCGLCGAENLLQLHNRWG